VEVDPLMSKPNGGAISSVGPLLGAISGMVPAAAAACAACAERTGGSSLRTIAVLASMILLPFVVAGVVMRIIRRIESES
jgi:hypothetical protein